MSTAEIRSGHVRSLQVFFENLINTGYNRNKGQMATVTYRRPEVAAPMGSLIQERMKAFFANPAQKQALIRGNDPRTDAMVQMDSKQMTQRQGSLVDRTPAVSGIELGLVTESAVLSDEQFLKKSLVDHTPSSQRSSMSSISTNKALLVSHSPATYAKVDSMIIDDPSLLARAAISFPAEMTATMVEEFNAASPSPSDSSLLIDVPTNKVADDDVNDYTMMDNQALFHARLIQDFISTSGAELQASRGEQVVAYEVNNEGWCLVRSGEEFGWIPQAFLELIHTDEPKGQAPFEIDFRRCIPRPEDRKVVFNFIEDSSLFSEARVHGSVEVFADAIDSILRAGRTIMATLAALFELDRNRRNYANLKELATAVKDLRDSWDEVENECRKIIRCGASMLFANPRTTVSSYQVLQLITATTCGSEIIDRLREEVAQQPKHNSFDDLLAVITARQRARNKDRDAKSQEDCQTVFLSLRRPELRLFRSFIDLRQNPILQLLHNGINVDEIVDALECLSAEGQHFDTLEAIMRAVFVKVTGGGDPSILCMGQGNSFASIAADEEEAKLQQMSPQQALQYKARVIMTALSKPNVGLFASLDSNISVKISDIKVLLELNPSLSSIICNIGILNAQGRMLESFQDLVDLQNDPSLSTTKQDALEFLKQNLNYMVMNVDTNGLTIDVVERLMNIVGAYGTFGNILQETFKKNGAPFESIMSLASVAAQVYIDREGQLKKDVSAIGAWFASNAVFRQDVELFDSSIEDMVKMAGSGERLLTALEYFKANRIAFDTLVSLTECIESYLGSAQ